MEFNHSRCCCCCCCFVVAGGQPASFHTAQELKAAHILADILTGIKHFNWNKSDTKYHHESNTMNLHLHM